MREYTAGYYSIPVYLFSKLAVEIPLSSSFVLISAASTYHVIGFNPLLPAFFSYLMMNTLLALVAIGLGFLFSCTIKDVNMALTLAPVITVPSMIFAGMLVNLCKIKSDIANLDSSI